MTERIIKYSDFSKHIPINLNVIVIVIHVCCVHTYGREMCSIRGVAKFFYYWITIGLDGRGRFVIEISKEKRGKEGKRTFPRVKNRRF